MFIAAETKKASYLLIVIIAILLALFICFREYLHTKLVSNAYCAHRHDTTAKLLHKSMTTGNCCWEVDNVKRCWETTHTCDDIEPGQVIPWIKINHDCDDLLLSPFQEIAQPAVDLID
jgi:hypothetical protein